MNILEIVGLTATVLSILGIVIGIAVRLASFPSERKITNLESENTQLRHKLDEVAESQKKLVETLSLIKTASSDAQVLKTEIEQELNYLAQIAGVKSASVLVPYPPDQSDRLVFLTILGPEANKLKHVVVNVSSSIAGEVFVNSKSRVVNNTKNDKKWNPKADQRTAFVTKNLLCVPLKLGGDVIGVAQFLNNPDGFDEQDKLTMEKAIKTLTLKVYKFVQREDYFEILGLGYAQDLGEGTVIITDLSASSSLLKGAHPLPKSDVISLINEYLEKITIAAINNGCIVDKFMWDGGIFSLNVANRVSDHKLVAYRASLEMLGRFDELKLSWLKAEYPVENLFCRIAISSGNIIQVDMGPPQYRQKTIVGDPVVVASALCANATRKQNVIIVDQSVYKAIESEHIKAIPIPYNDLGKAKGLITKAYQIELNHTAKE
jgi:class 3 adenylate cyclase/putative methionine-R-sulfoxide reductase with GAF domain